MSDHFVRYIYNDPFIILIARIKYNLCYRRCICLVEYPNNGFSVHHRAARSYIIYIIIMYYSFGLLSPDVTQCTMLIVSTNSNNYYCCSLATRKIMRQLANHRHAYYYVSLQINLPVNLFSPTKLQSYPSN